MVKQMLSVSTQDTIDFKKLGIDGKFMQKFQKLDELEFIDLIELLLSLSNVGIDNGIIKNFVDYFKDKSNGIIANLKNKEYLSNSDKIHLQYINPVVKELISKSQFIVEKKYEGYVCTEYKCEEFDFSHFTNNDISDNFTGNFILKKDSSGKILNIYFIDGNGIKNSIQDLNSFIETSKISEIY